MDILERLRWLARDEEAKDNLPPGLLKIAGDAADEIERLRAALTENADLIDPPSHHDEYTVDLRVVATNLRRAASAKTGA